MSQKYFTTPDNLKATLEQYGVAIIPDILTAEECLVMLSGMWDYFEHLTSKWVMPLNRNDKATWREFYKLYPLHSMLIQHWQVGHAQVSWNIRQNLKVIECYAKLWGTDELLVSFDGMSFNLPPEDMNKGWFRDNWFHTDQSYTRNKFECVQSWITALDVEEGDATLAVLEGSHKYHADFQKKYNIQNKSDWYKLSKEEELFYTIENKCELVRIMCPKGSMVFWSSQTIHSGSEALKGRLYPKLRAIIYLCYSPRETSSSANIKKRIKAFEDLRTTNHWPQKCKMFAKHPRSYGGEMPTTCPIDRPVLNEIGTRLIGY